MKYMTPELLARCQSTDDAVAEAATEQWDRACDEYNKYLDANARELPKGARKLLRKFCLHDAKVLTMAVSGSGSFSIFLELENPAGPKDRYLELRYKLAGGPRDGLRVKTHQPLGKPLHWWLYDEFDIYKRDGVVAYVHSILFNGGIELALTFFTLAFRRLDFLLPPVNEEGMIDPKELERRVRQPA